MWEIMCTGFPTYLTSIIAIQGGEYDREIYEI